MPKKRVGPLQVEDFNLQAFIVNICRRAFKKTPMYRDARNAAKHEYFVESKNGKQLRRVHYKCAQCGRFFRDTAGAREIAVDHIDPVVAVTGWVNFDTFIDRLFNGRLQVLCNYKGVKDGTRSCHAIKTKAENAERRAHAKKS